MNTVKRFLDVLYGPKGGGSTERPRRVLEFASLLDDSESRTFWAVVVETWSTFDLIPHAEFEAEFKRFGGSAPGIIGEKPLRLYRGQSAAAPVGLSWTSCFDTATRFACGHRGLINMNPVILKIITDPKIVAFECNDRGESEFVMLTRPTAFACVEVAS